MDYLSIARSFSQKTTALIESNSTWYYSGELSPTEDRFGRGVDNAVHCADQLIKMGSKPTKNAIDRFGEALGELILRCEYLMDYYKKQGSLPDMKIVTLFQRLTTDHSNDFKKISSTPINSQKGNNQKTKQAINLWLLRINGDNWDIDQFTIGAKYAFHAQRPRIGKASDYTLFQKVKVDDLCLIYCYKKVRAVVGVFRVTKALEGSQGNEIIVIEIVELPQTRIPFALLPPTLPFLSILEKGDPVKLIRLTQQHYDDIWDIVVPNIGGERITSPGEIPDVFADVANAKLKDQLNFEEDYLALASVLASKDFQPPVAVGLFGNWGSGKSFFMNKLKAAIEKNALSKNPEYCERIVHIRFNSWHYSDSNLWASLITKIFEDIKTSGEPNEDKKLEALFTNLNSTRELKQETQAQLAKVEKEISTLDSQVKVIQATIDADTTNLFNLKPVDILKGILEDAEVKKDIEVIQTKIPSIKTGDLEQINSSLNELESAGGKILETVKLLYSFRKGNLWYALVGAIAAFAIARYLIDTQPIQYLFGQAKGWLLALLPFLSQLGLVAKRIKPHIDDVHNRLVSLKKRTEELKATKKHEYEADKEKLQAKIANAQTLQNSLNEKLKFLELKKVEVETEVNNIASGKKIIGFIEGRVSDQRYINSLGIISWIRKDFEALDFLLKERKDARKLAELNETKIADVFQLDRIILYVDDLDRCDINVVVRVLEAIHLLLAFPLFVVVVGVDPRWMHNALRQKYNKFIGVGENNNNDHDANGTTKDDSQKDNNKDSDDNGAEVHVHGKPATSFDYLEKIFQIPFVLKPIDSAGRKKLIEANLKGDTEEKDEPTTSKEESKGDEKEKDLKNERKEDEDKKETKDQETKTVDDLNKKRAGNEPDLKRTEKTKLVAEEAASLTIPDNEIEFMKGISFLAGESPRAIKRFTNIYRIIRAHPGFVHHAGNKDECLYAAMILLGIITSYPENAGDFVAAIEAENDVVPFDYFFRDYQLDNCANKPFPSTLLAAVENVAALERAGEITIDKFKLNLDLICRFSFRAIVKTKVEKSERVEIN